MRYQVVTRSGRLHVRSGPGTRHRIIGALARGSTVEVAEMNEEVRSDPWARLTSGGWVSARYLRRGGKGSIDALVDAVIIVPSQGMHTRLFRQVARAVNRHVYVRRAKIVITTVAASGAVTFRDTKGRPFTWATARDLKSVVTISHGGAADGPNLGYRDDDSFPHQPWGCDTDTDTLKQRAKTFWTTVGRSLLTSGKIILMGCQMAMELDDFDPNTKEDFIYGKAVAKVTGRTVYASLGSIAAANTATVLQHIRLIDRGSVRRPMKRLSP